MQFWGTRMNKITVETVNKVKVVRGDITYEAFWEGGGIVTIHRNGEWWIDIDIRDGGEEICALLGLFQTLLVVIRERKAEERTKQSAEVSHEH